MYIVDAYKKKYSQLKSYARMISIKFRTGRACTSSIIFIKRSISNSFSLYSHRDIQCLRYNVNFLVGFRHIFGWRIQLDSVLN